MARRRRAERREIVPDAKFGDLVLAKFMNCLMYQGKKSVAKTVQPIDRFARDRFCHALHAVVIGPAIVAIEIALPFAKKIGDQRLDFSGHQPVLEIRGTETLPRSPRFEVVVGAVRLPSRIRILGVHRFGQSLFDRQSRLRAILNL